jgi:hypothetical protein
MPVRSLACTSLCQQALANTSFLHTVNDPQPMIHGKAQNTKAGSLRLLGTDLCQPNRQAATPTSGAQAGGGERNRTDDLLLAKQALSQLSYTPLISTWWA